MPRAMLVTGTKSFSTSNGSFLDDRRIDREAERRGEKGVAVRIRFRHEVRAEDAVGAAAVVDDDLLAEILLDVAIEHASEDVDVPARGKRNDHADRPGGIGFRRPRGGCDERKRQAAADVRRCISLLLVIGCIAPLRPLEPRETEDCCSQRAAELTFSRRGGMAMIKRTLRARRCSVFPLVACAAHAQYPTRPVRLVAAQSAGSSLDTVIRIVTGRLGEMLGQQMTSTTAAARQARSVSSSLRARRRTVTRCSRVHRAR